MQIIWNKIGLIFDPNLSKKSDNLYSHAANPVAINLEQDLYRIFYSIRDLEGKSNISYFDFNIRNLATINAYEPEFALLHGKKGSIDESGIGLGCAIKDKRMTKIIYMAWQTPLGHWKGDIAFANLLPTYDKLYRPSDNLILGVDSEDPISLSYPWIIFEDDVYHMWYGSTITWEYGNEEMLHVIKYAQSTDLKTWMKYGCCIPPTIGIAQAFSRPSVIKLNKIYHMWYSYRGNKDKYKIGYAHSINGKEWITFHDKMNTLSPSASGWDSEMVCYPCVFIHDNKLYMLYNGNSYGKTGIGLAVADIYESDN